MITSSKEREGEKKKKKKDKSIDLFLLVSTGLLVH